MYGCPDSCLFLSHVLAGATSLHLRLPQELHPERPQQEEEEDERRRRRVSRPRCGGSRGNVDSDVCSVSAKDWIKGIVGRTGCGQDSEKWPCVCLCLQVDLFQLQVNTLRRYKRHYKLQTRPGLNKAQLAEVRTTDVHSFVLSTSHQPVSTAEWQNWSLRFLRKSFWFSKEETVLTGYWNSQSWRVKLKPPSQQHWSFLLISITDSVLCKISFTSVFYQ